MRPSSDDSALDGSQLSFDSLADQRPLWPTLKGSGWLRDHVNDVTSRLTLGDSVFHKESSEISPYMFSIKLSHRGRSFLIKGGYRRVPVRSFYEVASEHTIIQMFGPTGIYAFRNGRYTSEFLPKHEQDGIISKVTEILSSPFHNEHIAQNEGVH